MTDRLHIFSPSRNAALEATPIISARQVSMAFGNLSVFSCLDLDIQRGTATLINGESGSGKSVLLSMLSGLRRPDSGSITAGGRVITNLNDDTLSRWRRRIGIVTQRPNVIGGLSALDNLTRRTALVNIKVSPVRARSILGELGIDRTDVPVGALSGGQQQRVAIANALAKNPHIIFADEPTAALDAANKLQAHEALLKARDSFGVTVVIASHDEVATSGVDRIVTLNNGELLEHIAATIPRPFDHIVD